MIFSQHSRITLLEKHGVGVGSGGGATHSLMVCPPGMIDRAGPQLSLLPKREGGDRLAGGRVEQMRALSGRRVWFLESLLGSSWARNSLKPWCSAEPFEGYKTHSAEDRKKEEFLGVIQAKMGSGEEHRASSMLDSRTSASAVIDWIGLD